MMKRDGELDNIRPWSLILAAGNWIDALELKQAEKLKSREMEDVGGWWRMN